MRARKLIVSLLVLAGTFATLLGCRKEDVSAGDARQETDSLQLKELEDTFKLVGTWQAYREASHNMRFFGGSLGMKINAIKDPDVRMKYFWRLHDLAFSVPLNATDPATRSHQLTSFRVMTDDVKGCAEGAEDVYNEWEIGIRRVKILKAEMQKVELFFDGKGGEDTFKGSRQDWQDYRRKVKGAYNYEAHELSRYFGDMRTANGLTYEQWHSMRSQLESVLGHKVKVWPSVIEKWERAREERVARPFGGDR